MKYDGLKLLSSTARETVTVVHAKNEEESKPQGKKRAPKKPVAQPLTAPAQNEGEADEAALKPAPLAKRSILRIFARQFFVVALIVCGLLALKFADGGFAADVFEGVKDIISYNYEAASPIYGNGATVVDAIVKLFT